MPEIVKKLKEAMETGSADPALLKETLQELVELREKRDALEEILIILVRTGLPWDEEGRPTEKFPAFQERYQRFMHEAAEILGLDLRSTITRTEPRT